MKNEVCEESHVVSRKQKRLDIEQAKIQERMDMYARQDQQRAARKSLFTFLVLPKYQSLIFLNRTCR